jgi:hypothetical protein
MRQGRPQRVIPPNSHRQRCYKIGGITIAVVYSLIVQLCNVPVE